MKSWVVLVLACSTGCSDAVLPAVEEAVPDAPGFRLECVSAVVIDGAAQVIGLDAASLAGTTVQVTSADGAVLADAPVDADGRFAAPIAATVGEVVGVRSSMHPDDRWPLRVRDARAALGTLARPPDPGSAGSTPNDLVPLPDGRAVLVRSGDDAIVVYALDQGLASGRGIRLPEGDPKATPWFAVPIDARTVAVTAQGRHVVYLVDVDAGAVVDTLVAPAPLPLDRPFTLARPYDVDGDGTAEATITRAPARAPQGVAVSGDRLVVAFTGFVSAAVGGQPSVFVPGVLASWSLADLAAPPVVALTPMLDPQEVHALEDGTVLVIASGPVEIGPGGGAITSSGAVSRHDATTLAALATWPLGDFGPTTARIAGDLLWVASLRRAEVRALPLTGGDAVATLTLNSDVYDSVFRWVDLPCGLLGAPSYDTDRIHVIDPRTRRLDPAPFLGPIVVGPGRPLFDGLQAVARRPGRAGVDFVGPDLFVLGSNSRVTPVELRRILGP